MLGSRLNKMMKRGILLCAFVSAMFVALSACHISIPTPNPIPTPSPTPAASLLLTRNGTVFTDGLGKPFDVRGEASCCFSEDPEPDPGWALASRAFIKRTAEHKNNLIHMRLGPYRVQPDWGAEQNSAGSPYLEVNGCADLTQWDPRFMTYLKDRITYGASLGVRFELDIADGWGLKNQKARPHEFPQGHPWVQSSNCQHEDWITSSGTSVPKGVHEAWIRHIVDELGAFDNVIYQVGNENGQIKGIVADWEIGTCNIVHDEESKRSLKRHLCGSNVPELVANRAEIDYLTTHEALPLLQSQCFDVTRPCRNNEMNNPLTGKQWFAYYCAAKKNGTYLDFWRAEMPLKEAQIAWDLSAKGCEGAPDPGCADIPDETAIQVLPKPASLFHDQVNAALKALHPECDINSRCPINEPIQQFLQEFAAKVREDPSMCAGIQNTPEGPVDEVCVGLKVPGTTRCDLCQGQHVFACKTGCTSGTISYAPGSYNRASDTWKRP